MKKLIVAPVLSLLLLAIACSTDKSLPSGFDSLHRTSTGEIKVLYAPLLQAAQFRAPVKAGLAPTLLLGKHAGVTSRVALRFTNFSSVDTATVSSATLTFNQSAKWGDGSEFAGTVHLINTSWDESSVTWDNLKNAYDPSGSFASYTVQPLDSTTVSVQVPPEWINSWINKSNNYGFLLDFPQAAFMAQWISVDVTQNWPTLSMVFTTKSGTLDTVAVGPTEDASLLEYDQLSPAYTLETDLEKTLLDNAKGYRTLLRFDLSALPVQATIHQAQFALNLDLAATTISSDGLEIVVNSVRNDSAWQNLDEMAVDTVYIHPNGTINQDVATMTISATPHVTYMTALIQRITLGTVPNYGFVVQSTEYGSDLSSATLYTEATASGIKPSLKITYALPASPRF